MTPNTVLEDYEAFEDTELPDSPSFLGAYIKPSLSAQPSPVVTEGGNVILQCVSKQGYYKLTLTKEGQQKYFWTPDSVYHNSTGHYQARFSVGPVTSSQRLIFRCYSFGSFSTLVWSEPSESLELLFSGEEPQSLCRMLLD